MPIWIPAGIAAIGGLIGAVASNRQRKVIEYRYFDPWGFPIGYYGYRPAFYVNAPVYYDYSPGYYREIHHYRRGSRNRDYSPTRRGYSPTHPSYSPTRRIDYSPTRRIEDLSDEFDESKYLEWPENGGFDSELSPNDREATRGPTVVEVSEFPPGMSRKDAIAKARDLLSKLRHQNEPPILKVEEQMAKSSNILDLEDNDLMGKEVQDIKKTFLGYVEEVREGRRAWLHEVELLWEAFEARFEPLTDDEIKTFNKELRKAEGPEDDKTGVSRAAFTRATGVSRAPSKKQPTAVYKVGADYKVTEVSSPYSTKVESCRMNKKDSAPAHTVRPVAQLTERPANAKTAHSTSVKSNRPENLREPTAKASSTAKGDRTEKGESSKSKSSNSGKNRVVTDRPPAPTVVVAPSKKTDAKKLTRVETLRGATTSKYASPPVTELANLHISSPGSSSGSSSKRDTVKALTRVESSRRDTSSASKDSKRETAKPSS